MVEKIFVSQLVDIVSYFVAYHAYKKALSLNVTNLLTAQLLDMYQILVSKHSTLLCMTGDDPCVNLTLSLMPSNCIVTK